MIAPIRYIRSFGAQVQRDGLKATVSKRARMWKTRQLHTVRTQLDIARDKRVTGISLEENVISPFAESHGAKDTIQTPYGTLEAALEPEAFTADDVLLDVGCGMGRPLAYLLGRKFPGKLVGVEINPPVAQRAAEWAAKFPNVEIVTADVFEHNLNPYTRIFMWTPMLPYMTERFLLKMERELTHPVRLYYLSDHHTGDFLDKRPGWALVRRDWVDRVHGLPQHGTPQRYSVWDFTPQGEKRHDADACGSGGTA